VTVSMSACLVTVNMSGGLVWNCDVVSVCFTSVCSTLLFSVWKLHFNNVVRPLFSFPRSDCDDGQAKHAHPVRPYDTAPPANGDRKQTPCVP
jgi:hypothetical protein